MIVIFAFCYGYDVADSGLTEGNCLESITLPSADEASFILAAPSALDVLLSSSVFMNNLPSLYLRWVAPCK